MLPYGTIVMAGVRVMAPLLQQTMPGPGRVT